MKMEGKKLERIGSQFWACLMVQNSQVSRDNFIFQDGTWRDVNTISVVGYDDHCALREKEIIIY